MSPYVISIGSGRSQRPLIQSAQRQGFKVLGIDRAPDYDLLDEAIICSTYDAEEALRLVCEHPLRNSIRAVLARTSGPALITAAKISKKLAVSGTNEFLARLSLSKSDLRNVCELKGVSSPKGQAYQECPALPEGTWVVKPDQPLYGKKNVYCVQTQAELSKVFDKCVDESVNGCVEIQTYEQGEDIGLVLLMKAGEILWHGFYQEVVELNSRQFSGAGVKGPWHGDGEPKMIEIARNIIGHEDVSGFVFFSFRVSEDSQAMHLYEVNPGLCGDGLADKLMPTIWTCDDFFSLDVAIHTNTPFKLPSENGINFHVK